MITLNISLTAVGGSLLLPRATMIWRRTAPSAVKIFVRVPSSVASVPANSVLLPWRGASTPQQNAVDIKGINRPKALDVYGTP